MPEMDLFKIDLRGIHSDPVRFGYKLDDSFFEGLEQDEIKGGQLDATLTVRELTADAYELHFAAVGSVTVVCDRCLDDLELPVSIEKTIKLKDADEADETDDIKAVPLATGTYDVAWDFYEFIELSLPIQRVHEPADCNPDMIGRLQSHTA